MRIRHCDDRNRTSLSMVQRSHIPYWRFLVDEIWVICEFTHGNAEHLFESNSGLVRGDEPGKGRVLA
jgi:hypothetical protein